MADLKKLARRLAEEVYGKGDLAVVDELCAPNFKGYDWALGKLDRAGVKKQVTRMRTAFPDMKVVVNDYIIEGNRVVELFQTSGTQKGDYMGNPPSNKKFSIDGLGYSLFDKNGKIVEAHLYYDTMTIAQQLGIVPPLGKVAGKAKEARPTARR